MNENGHFPFVRLMDAAGLAYPEGKRFAAAISAQLNVHVGNRERRCSPPPTTIRKTSKTIDDSHEIHENGGDATRQDQVFAVYAISHGTSTDQVVAALRSRDLSHKGDEKRQDQYMDRSGQSGKGTSAGMCLGYLTRHTSAAQAKRRLTPSHVFAVEHSPECCKGCAIAQEKDTKSSNHRCVGLKEWTSIRA